MDIYDKKVKWESGGFPWPSGFSLQWFEMYCICRFLYPAFGSILKYCDQTSICCIRPEAVSFSPLPSQGPLQKIKFGKPCRPRNRQNGASRFNPVAQSPIMQGPAGYRQNSFAEKLYAAISSLLYSKGWPVLSTASI